MIPGFSYLNFFMFICTIEVQHVPKEDGKILVDSYARRCVLDHNSCMIKRLNFRTSWTPAEVELKASACAETYRKLQARKKRVRDQ